MAVLQDLFTRFGRGREPVFSTGDLNVNHRKDRLVRARIFPYRSLGRVGARASWEVLGLPRRGTHVLPNGNDTRLIDSVWYLRLRKVAPVQQHILGGYFSDHRPVMVKFRVT